MSANIHTAHPPFDHAAQDRQALDPPLGPTSWGHLTDQERRRSQLEQAAIDIASGR